MIPRRAYAADLVDVKKRPIFPFQRSKSPNALAGPHRAILFKRAERKFVGPVKLKYPHLIGAAIDFIPRGIDLCGYSIAVNGEFAGIGDQRAKQRGSLFNICCRLSIVRGQHTDKTAVLRYHYRTLEIRPEWLRRCFSNDLQVERLYAPASDKLLCILAKTAIFRPMLVSRFFHRGALFPALNAEKINSSCRFLSPKAIAPTLFPKVLPAVHFSAIC